MTRDEADFLACVLTEFMALAVRQGNQTMAAFAYRALQVLQEERQKQGAVVSSAMRSLLLLLVLACPLLAQTNSLCPNATGPLPHCVSFTYGPPASGPSPSAYNVYSGGTKAGQCAPPTVGTCSKIGTIAAGILLFTWNSSASAPLTEGATYYFVATSLNGTAESAPTPEVSATIPFLTPLPPSSFAATAH